MNIILGRVTAASIEDAVEEIYKKHPDAEPPKIKPAGFCQGQPWWEFTLAIRR